MCERIWFGFYQSPRNRGSVGRVFVFELRWCGWCCEVVDGRLGPGSGSVG